MYLLYVKFYNGIPLLKKKDSQEEDEEFLMKKTLSSNKDAWYFDLGSNIAFSTIVYCVVVLFSQVAPIITPFGVLYFTFKYLIDKYNIMNVFPTEYVGEGRLYTHIIRLQYFAMFLH